MSGGPLDVRLRRAKEATRDNQGLAQAVVEGLTEGVVVQDADGAILWANPAACAMLGLSLDVLTGLTSFDPRWHAVREDGTDWPGEEHPATVTRRTGRPCHDVVIGMRDPTSEIRWLLVNSERVLLEGSAHAGVVISFIDITDRKRAEEDLRLARARVRAFIEANIVGIVIARADGPIVEANDYYLDLIGFTRAELERGELDWRSVTPPEWLPVSDRAIGEIRTRGTSVPYEKEYLRADGTRVPVLVMAAGLPGADELIAAIVLDNTERTRDAEALRSSAARLRTALETMLEGVIIASAVRDEDGRIIDFRIDYANPAIGGISWVAAGEQAGHTLLELFPAHRTNGLLDAYVRVVETGVPFGSADFHYVDPDAAGGRLDQFLDQHAAKLGDGYLLSVRDVTARHAVEAERSRLASIIEQSPDGTIIVGADLRITYANAGFAQDLGWTQSELVGRSVFEVVDGVLDAPTIATLRKVARAGRPWLGEAARRLANGTVGPVEITVTPHRAADGTLEEYVVVSRDVSQLRAAQAERARLATAVEQAADFIIVNDRDGTVEAVNPAFERLTGYPAAEALGRPVTSLLRSGVDPPEVYAALDDALRLGKVWTGRLAERRADGSLLDVDLSVSPIRDAAGGLIGTVEIGRDRTHEREMDAERERETQIRTALAASLEHVPADATLKQAAQAICDELTTLPFIDVAEIEVFLGADDVQILAVSAPLGYPPIAGSHLAPMRAAIVRERSTSGPWAQLVTSDPADGWIPGDVAAGLKALAYGPIVYGDHVSGALLIGTFDEHFARTLVEQMPAIVSFSATSSALLAERLHTWRVETELRQALAAVLASRSFHPVFQPIVDLETREMVGYEALTRFDSGQRPDLCFSDAWSVGLGLDMELATLGAAVAAGKLLPAGRWLDLNVSPRLLAEPEHLSAVLWSAGRPLVLEVTEHEVIEDYAVVREVMSALGRDVRVAVDDAGAGVANFGHIIELRPDFVKLDISLVRRVNANLGRQAMVIGMRHFSRTAGCRLIAEGIETEEEASTLIALGVEFGQGYLFGHPEPVEAWTDGDRERRRETSQAILPSIPRAAEGPAAAT